MNQTDCQDRIGMSKDCGSYRTERDRGGGSTIQPAATCGCMVEGLLPANNKTCYCCAQTSLHLTSNLCKTSKITYPNKTISISGAASIELWLKLVHYIQNRVPFGTHLDVRHYISNDTLTQQSQYLHHPRTMNKIPQ